MQEGTQKRRVNSITGKLHRAYLFKKIRFYIVEDLLAFCLTTFGALAQMEYVALGGFATNASRYLESNDAATTRMEYVRYIVADENGKVLTQAYLFPLFRVALIVVGALAIWQLLSLTLFWAKEDRRIRKILSPLTELAVKADELGRMSFGEDKYQRIEDAIERMQVDETQKLSFGDEDLRGIEAAMNNLLTRMREANMQQARFVNDASHELRTPIAVIQGYANMLDRWGKEDEKILSEAIEAIKQESDHMSRLVEQLLFLARGDAGRTELRPETIDLNAFMKEIYEESLMIDEAHPYRFLPEETGSARATADRGLLKQAVRALVDNAAKYTQAGDEITLRVGRETEGDGCVYLQVQDTGRGMQEADVAHMFDRFYRAEDARGDKGTGLGLSIAKWIVDKHGAHFEVLSRKDLGTRIRVVLAS